jgi:cytosine/adenosine deaminase-related metal-dependent hydrolase
LYDPIPMALVLVGKVAPMARGREVETFTGRVWIGDDGLVEKVTRRGQAAPSGFAEAPVVDVGDAVIYPGFVDLHSHLGYNSLPLWAEPDEPAPYLHRGIWPGRATYKPEVSWPAWTLMELATETMYAYVQVRALAGGTTAIQGWPSASRPPTNRLVRPVDDDVVGTRADPVSVSVVTLDRSQLRARRDLLRAGTSFIYHLSEGQRGSNVAKEFGDVSRSGCLQAGLIAIHANALDPAMFATWRDKARPTRSRPAGTIVWSPFSNLWLYGTSTLVPDAVAAKVNVALGTDWGPSGTKNLLGEIKVARLWSDHEGWGLEDRTLVEMITANPGDALRRAWEVPVGRLQRGALGDVTVLARRSRDAFRNVVEARDDDVALVVVGGQPLFGTRALMRAAGAVHTTAVPMGSASRRVSLVRPDDPSATWTWTDVVDRLEKARRSAARTPPRGASAGRGVGHPRRATRSFDPTGTAPMAVRLDMPGGPQEGAGPPPRGKTVKVPPIEPLHHDRRWVASITGRGFHGGVLDGLRRWYG